MRTCMESRLGVLLQAFVLLWRGRRQPHRRRHRVHRAHRADMRDAVASVKRALSPRLVIMFGVCNIGSLYPDASIPRVTWKANNTIP